MLQHKAEPQRVEVREPELSARMPRSRRLPLPRLLPTCRSRSMTRPSERRTTNLWPMPLIGLFSTPPPGSPCSKDTHVVGVERGPARRWPTSGGHRSGPAVTRWSCGPEAASASGGAMGISRARLSRQAGVTSAARFAGLRELHPPIGRSGSVVRARGPRRVQSSLRMHRRSPGLPDRQFLRGILLR